MPASDYAVAITIALLGGAVAVFLQRRLPDRIHASYWASLLFGTSAVGAYYLATGGLPPAIFWSESENFQLWELLVLPIFGLCVVWPALLLILFKSAALRLWTAMALAAAILLTALPTDDSYADYIPGNGVWSLAAVLAIGANYLAGEQLDSTGALRWSMWVFVAQLYTVAALLMTCYGSLGEWCAVVALTLGVLAGARLFSGGGRWSSQLSLPATALSCILLSLIRIYSSHALPGWLAPLPMLSPVIVCCVDQAFGVRKSSAVRVITAAVSAALIATVIVVTVLMLSDPEV